MKRQLVKYGLIIGVAVSGIVGVVLTKGQGQDPDARKKVDDERSRIVQAVRRGGLREAARIKGNYVSTHIVESPVYSGLEALASHSSLIIVGTPSRNVCHLPPNGIRLTTDYDVEVQDVIKGDLKQGDTVTVSLPGGRVEFEDGTSAEIRAPEFRKMENHKTYLLFLFEQKGRPGTYKVVGGPQGLFELPADSDVVKPHGRSIDFVTEKYKNKEQKAFLKEVQEAAKKWPEPGTCCD